MLRRAARLWRYGTGGGSDEKSESILRELIFSNILIVVVREYPPFYYCRRCEGPFSGLHLRPEFPRRPRPLLCTDHRPGKRTENKVAYRVDGPKLHQHQPQPTSVEIQPPSRGRSPASKGPAITSLAASSPHSQLTHSCPHLILLTDWRLRSILTGVCGAY